MVAPSFPAFAAAFPASTGMPEDRARTAECLRSVGLSE
jgi:hypothetical protein